MADPPSAPWLQHLRDEVRARLRARRATQAALARHLGISPKHLSQVLNGAVTGSPELHDRMAQAVGLRIAIVVTDLEPATLARDQRGRKSRQEKLAGRTPEKLGSCS